MKGEIAAREEGAGHTRAPREDKKMEDTQGQLLVAWRGFQSFQWKGRCALGAEEHTQSVLKFPSSIRGQGCRVRLSVAQELY